MKTIIVIPARMASIRFPNKPMAKIDGKPMIQRVWEQAMLSKLGEVVVACSEKEVFDLITSLGGRAVMTNPELPSGTDRVYSAIKDLTDISTFDSVINLQGDMPLINPSDIIKVNKPLYQGFEIGTIATGINIEEENNKNITKVKIKWIKKNIIGQAIDFYKKPKNILKNIYHHVGIYSFRIDSLKKFVHLSPSQNELSKKLEQWRALDANITLGITYVDDVPISVDTKEDIIHAENIIRGR